MAELTEAVAVAAEEVSEQAEHVAKVSRALSGREMGLVFWGSCIGLTGGLVIGYYYAKRKTEDKAAAAADEVIAEMREHYNAKLEATVARIDKPGLEQVMTGLGYTPPKEEAPVKTPPVITESPAPVVEVEKEEIRNVFDIKQDVEVEVKDDIDEWDYDEELKRRRSDVPYVIHMDEFTENESGFEQQTLSYYEDDDVLADERDNAIEDMDDLVGVQNLGLFGHGSGDPNAVYVRNEQLKMEFEIIRNSGNYAEQVHGFIKHADAPRRRRPGRHTGWDG